ncbi:MauE/DoxX family redox-associated membrane protein [Aeromicrobium sp.]|uniref:DoxX family protein n=1 Tax=Aeromicrobium sp. TaxID=1871063 RepID=UPI0028AA4720|nr:MauE/DoxX family redox-associated membrane protein [Aeromicrobium sp.]
MKTIARLLLGGILAFAGVSHLTFARDEFQAQVPRSIPIDEDFTVVASGIVEIALGAALMALPRHRRIVGLVVAAFFVAVFPGNIAQYLNHADGFGLDTDRARFGRLFFQPVLVLWALWSTDALQVVSERLRRGTAR